MKKLLLALSIFVIIILFSILTMSSFKRSSQKISVMVEKSSKFISIGRWDDAQNQIVDIEKIWSKTEKTWALLIDHMEIDNIDISLIKSKKYIETKNLTLSLSELDILKFMIEHISDKELFNLKNIF